MKVSFAFVILLLSLVSLVQGNVYGVVTNFANNYTTTTLYVVEIDTNTGNFTYLTETFKYLGGSLAYDGVSGFDQKRGNLYYAVNYESDFIFSVNVNTSSLLPPISIGANCIQNFVYDFTNDNMYVLGTFEDETNSEQEYVYLISLSLNNGPDTLALNLTSAGISELDVSAMDYDTGTYFMVTDGLFASFNIQDPKNVFTTTVVCPNNLSPIYISYNYKTSTIIGVGEGSKPSLHYAFLEFTITGDTVKCSATKILLKEGSIATSFSLDPVEQILYIGYTNANGQSSLAIYNINTKTLSSVPVPLQLSDVQVSYTPLFN